MSESERPTEPGGLEPPQMCDGCKAVLDMFAQLRQDVLDAVSKPPWLPRVLEAVSAVSAVTEMQGELAAHRERLASLEGTCDEQHPERRCPILPPPNGNGGG